MKRLKKFFSEETAQALVEFTLILPILILLIFGMIEFGWVFNAQLTLNSAAREGARTGAVLQTSGDERKNSVMAAVEETAQNSGLIILEEESTVTQEDDTEADIHNIVVSVKAEVTPLIGFFVHEKVVLSADATMRRE